MKRLGNIESHQKLISLLKDNVQGEKDAISLYQETLSMIEGYDDVKDRIKEIMNDEKEHLKELIELLNKHEKK